MSSFIINMNRSLRLINRPHFVKTQQLGNEDILTEIASDYTYSFVGSNITNALGFLDTFLI